MRLTDLIAETGLHDRIPRGGFDGVRDNEVTPAARIRCSGHRRRGRIVVKVQASRARVADFISWIRLSVVAFLPDGETGTQAQNAGISDTIVLPVPLPADLYILA